MCFAQREPETLAQTRETHVAWPQKQSVGRGLDHIKETWRTPESGMLQCDNSLLKEGIAHIFESSSPPPSLTF